MPGNPSPRVLGSRVAVLTRHRGADHPETRDARREHAAVRLGQYIQRTLDAADLSSEQRNALARQLLTPAAGGRS